MLLDLDSRLGLVSLKLLWETEDLLGMGIYASLEVAERTRHTAEEWGLGDRMFFQVGDVRDLNLKTGYFDMVISDGILQSADRPGNLLGEIGRVSKPGAAILLGQAARPSRLRLSGALDSLSGFPDALRPWRERSLRSGFTRAELETLVQSAGLERTRIVLDDDRLYVERPGRDDPASWVTERERYR
jgi:SAM-dependent methyltransferase